MADANTDLQVGPALTIAGSELEWSFGPSGGPGGQHANRAHTRVELRFDVARSQSIDDRMRARILGNLGTRQRGGVLVVIVDESRSQFRNRQIARRRLAELLSGAARPPPMVRRPTKPSRSARRRRLEDKKRRGDVKRLRRPPDDD